MPCFCEIKKRLIAQFKYQWQKIASSLYILVHYRKKHLRPIGIKKQMITSSHRVDEIYVKAIFTYDLLQAFDICMVLHTINVLFMKI
jgi:hypothetical protein